MYANVYMEVSTVQGMTISEKVIGCAIEVSNKLGAGFLESVQENVLCQELTHQGVEFEQQKAVNVHYRESVVGKYIVDLLVESKLLIELKTVSQFSKQHDAQLMNYLRATGISVGCS